MRLQLARVHRLSHANVATTATSAHNSTDSVVPEVHLSFIFGFRVVFMSIPDRLSIDFSNPLSHFTGPIGVLKRIPWPVVEPSVPCSCLLLRIADDISDFLKLPEPVNNPISEKNL